MSAPATYIKVAASDMKLAATRSRYSVLYGPRGAASAPRATTLSEGMTTLQGTVRLNAWAPKRRVISAINTHLKNHWVAAVPYPADAVLFFPLYTLTSEARSRSIPI